MLRGSRVQQPSSSAQPPARQPNLLEQLLPLTGLLFKALKNGLLTVATFSIFAFLMASIWGTFIGDLIAEAIHQPLIAWSASLLPTALAPLAPWMPVLIYAAPVLLGYGHNLWQRYTNPKAYRNIEPTFPWLTIAGVLAMAVIPGAVFYNGLTSGLDIWLNLKWSALIAGIGGLGYQLALDGIEIYKMQQRANAQSRPSQQRQSQLLQEKLGKHLSAVNQSVAPDLGLDGLLDSSSPAIITSEIDSAKKQTTRANAELDASSAEPPSIMRPDPNKY